MTRLCLGCGVDITGSHFNRRYCTKECRYEVYGPKARNSSIQWRRENRERALRSDHNKHLMKQYGITIEKYEQMIEDCGNKCQICGRTPEEIGDLRRLAVDHCHDTGRIRGILCRWCNTAIGQLQDSIEVVENAVQYMKANYLV